MVKNRARLVTEKPTNINKDSNAKKDASVLNFKEAMSHLGDRRDPRMEHYYMHAQLQYQFSVALGA